MAATVRTAVPADGPAIEAVRFAGWRAAYGHLIPADAWDQVDRARVAERISAGIESGRSYLVAELDATVAGFVGYGPCRDDDLPDAGEVYAIYVHPDSWSSGVGRLLLTAAVRGLPMRPVVLWVLADNPRARRFYELAGWRSDGGQQLADLIGGASAPELRYRLDEDPAELGSPV